MPFSSQYFSQLGEMLREHYFNDFKCGSVQIKIHTTVGEYLLHSVRDAAEESVTFTYYDDEKLLDEKPWGKCWPAVSIPYQVILKIDILPKPEKTDKSTIGFGKNH